MEAREKLIGILRELAIINNALERILHLQFGIEGKEWCEAISSLEAGYANVFCYIQDRLEEKEYR